MSIEKLPSTTNPQPLPEFSMPPHMTDYKVGKVAKWCFVEHPVVTYFVVGAVVIACAIQFPLIPVIGALASVLLLTCFFHGQILQRDTIYQTVNYSLDWLKEIKTGLDNLRTLKTQHGIDSNEQSSSKKLQELIDENSKYMNQLKNASHTQGSEILRDLQRVQKKIGTLHTDITRELECCTIRKNYLEAHKEEICFEREDIAKAKRLLDELKATVKDRNNEATKIQIDEIDQSLTSAENIFKAFLAGRLEEYFYDNKRPYHPCTLVHEILDHILELQILVECELNGYPEYAKFPEAHREKINQARADIEKAKKLLEEAKIKYASDEQKEREIGRIDFSLTRLVNFLVRFSAGRLPKTFYVNKTPDEPIICLSQIFDRISNLSPQKV